MPSRIARRPLPTRNGASTSARPARPRPRAALRIAKERGEGRGQRRARRAPATITPVRPSSTTVAIPPAGVLTSGVPDASASSTVLGSPSTLPLSSRTDGATADVGRGEPAADRVLCQVAEEVDAIGDAARSRRARAAPRRDRRRRRSRGAPAPRCRSSARASIRYSNPFFLTSRPAANSSGAPGGMPRRARAASRAPGAGLNLVTSTP